MADGYDPLDWLRQPFAIVWFDANAWATKLERTGTFGQTPAVRRRLKPGHSFLID
jgi:hypothetical protein